MRECIITIACAIAFGMACAAYFAGEENARLAAEECPIHDCWE